MKPEDVPFRSANTGRGPNLSDIPIGPEFIARAACASADPESFFPENGASSATARRICKGCDARIECLEWAISNDERFGLWGGLNETERGRIRRGYVPRHCAQTGCDELLPLGAAPHRLYCGSICQSRAREERRLAKREAS